MTYTGWLQGTNPVCVADKGICRECFWSVSYRSRDGKWKSKTLAQIKAHVRATRHSVEYHQERFAVVGIPESAEDQKPTTGN